MNEEKAKAREFWLEKEELGAFDRPDDWHYIHVTLQDPGPDCEMVHVVEIQALQEAQKEIAELKAKLWELRKTGQQIIIEDEASKKSLREMLEKMASALVVCEEVMRVSFHERLCLQTRGCYCKPNTAFEALKEYEEWRSKNA